MRDSRVTVWTNPTTLTNGSPAVNGPDIDLEGDYTGDHLYGANPSYGLGVEIIFKSVVLGTDADGFTVAAKWQVAPNNGGVAGAYVDWEPIGTVAYDEVNLWTKDGTLTGAALGLSRAKLKARLKGSPHRFARLVITATDLEGTGTVAVYAFVSDATDALNTGLTY